MHEGMRGKKIPLSEHYGTDFMQISATELKHFLQ